MGLSLCLQLLKDRRRERKEGRGQPNVLVRNRLPKYWTIRISAFVANLMSLE